MTIDNDNNQNEKCWNIRNLQIIIPSVQKKKSVELQMFFGFLTWK